MRAAAIVLMSTLVASCGAPPVDATWVLVTVSVPPTLTFDGFRIAKAVGDAPPVVQDRQPRGPGGDLRTHIVGVSVPLGVLVTVEIQALYQQAAVAEGSVPVDGTRADVRVELQRCDPPVDLQDGGFLSCQRPGALRAPRPRAAGAAAPDGGPADGWTAPVCQAPGTPPPVEPSPEGAPPGCAAYCAGMDLRCPEVYRGLDRCLHACRVLAWRPTGAGDDTLECRTLWATADLVNVTDEANRCSFASPLSHEVCGEICAVYCRTGALVCAARFPPEQPCREACIRTKNALLPAALIDYMGCQLDSLARAIFEPALCSDAAPNTSCGRCPAIYFDL